MDGIDFVLFCQRNDAVDVQIRLHRALTRAHLVRLVGLEAVQSKPVFSGIDRHRAQAQFGSRAEDSNGDFTAVRRQYFSDRFSLRHQRSVTNTDKTASQNFRLFHERGKAQQQFIRFGEETKFLVSGARLRSAGAM